MFLECYVVSVIDTKDIKQKVVFTRVAFLAAVENVCKYAREQFPNQFQYKVVTIKASLYCEDEAQALAERPKF